MPNAVCFNTCITACCRGDRWQTGLNLFFQMHPSEVRPTVFSYTAGIGTLEEAGGWGMALQLLSGMPSSKVEFSTISFSALQDPSFELLKLLRISRAQIGFTSKLFLSKLSPKPASVSEVSMRASVPARKTAGDAPPPCFPGCRRRRSPRPRSVSGCWSTTPSFACYMKYVCTYLYIYIYTYLHIHISVCIHLFLHIYVCTLYIYVYMYIYIYIYI